MERPNTHTHQNRAKVEITCGMYNIRNGGGRDGALPEIQAAVKNHAIDILLLTEPQLDKEFGKDFETSTHIIKGAMGKTAWMIDRTFVYNVQQTNISERVNVLKVRSINTAFVGIYAPADTVYNTTAQRIKFFKDLPNLIRECVDDGMQIVLLGDWNISLPPCLLQMWDNPTHEDNHAEHNFKLTKNNAEIAEEALTATADMHIHITKPRCSSKVISTPNTNLQKNSLRLVN